MIPNNLWSADANQQQINTFGIPKPDYTTANSHDIELGPLELNNSQNSLAKSYWLFEVVEGVVQLSKFNEDNTLGSPVALFASGETHKLSGTFDQLGKPLVFYDTGTELRLWWYNPLIEGHTTTVFGVGKHPFATFDIRRFTGYQNSDALLFYVRDGAIYYRVQRDRYDIEYATPVTPYIDELLQADMSVDYRMQLLYRYKDTGYVPPTPIPPVMVPQTGYWKYKLTGYGSRISIGNNFWYDTKDDLTVSFIIDEVDLDKSKIVIFSQCFATHFVEQGSSQGRYGAQLLATVGGVNHDILTLIVGGYKSVLPMPVKLQPGSWTFALSGGLMSISFTSLDNSNTVTLDNLSYAIGKNVEAAYVLIFGGDGSINPKNSFRGVMREMRASSMGRDIYCPGDDNSEIDGSYLPVYNADRTVKLYNARILNDYRNANWVFQPA